MSHLEAIKQLSKTTERLHDEAIKKRGDAENARAMAVSIDAKADQLDAEADEYETAIQILEAADTAAESARVVSGKTFSIGGHVALGSQGGVPINADNSQIIPRSVVKVNAQTIQAIADFARKVPRKDEL